MANQGQAAGLGALAGIGAAALAVPTGGLSLAALPTLAAGGALGGMAGGAAGSFIPQEMGLPPAPGAPPPMKPLPQSLMGGAATTAMQRELGQLQPGRNIVQNPFSRLQI